MRAGKTTVPLCDGCIAQQLQSRPDKSIKYVPPSTAQFSIHLTDPATWEERDLYLCYAHYVLGPLKAVTANPLMPMSPGWEMANA